ncbi:CIS tube protein [Crossiella cryophila]|uniref:Contractile injection system tube protein N-terminal domain-containing protein n=1 Tax=Crossiella cryophila TaxID=43355 RepID=A0A7W7CF49_9PSEU|nr:hypothetical protein [Crossiella cryophila]MBB4680009.1 hypothetical protein [Crossiella cryophila]
MSDSYHRIAERRVRAQLVCRMPPSPGLVLFDFNPEQIRMRRSVEWRFHGNSAALGATPPIGSSPLYFKRSEPPVISVDNVIFDGPDTKAKCDQLLNWMTPGGGALDMLAAGAVPLAVKSLSGGLGKKIGGLVSRPFKDYTSRLPRLTFNWGPPIAGFWYEVHLKHAGISYTRFSPVGIPVRAKVNLELQEVPSLASTMPTNPTSGGPPGRGGHSVSERETLPGIALEHYGRPGEWRRLAEVNEVDDPLRMRPGETLYLPNAEELHEEAAG